MSSLSLPSAAILEWLDSHVQVRMSILFAYMFGKSQLAAQLLTWLAQTWAPVRAALDPLIVTLGYGTSSLCLYVIITLLSHVSHALHYRPS